MISFWLWLYSLPDIGSRTIVRLCRRFGINANPDAVCSYVGKWERGGKHKDGWTGSCKEGGTGMRGANLAGTRKDEWEEKGSRILDQLGKMGVSVVPFWSGRYPSMLKEIGDFPAFLFYMGSWNKNHFDQCVAIVGTRRMSTYGRSVVRRIVKPLVGAGSSVVSGLAVGVDAEVHTEVLRNNRVGNGIQIAVLPGGPIGGYPLSNTALFHEIMDSGGLVLWEFLPGTHCSSGMFAGRNRLIAGLSKAVVVIESASKGGSLITADLALQYNREVCAVPGSIFSQTSDGTNDLIRQGAHVVCGGRDILQVIDLDADDSAGSSGDAVLQSTVQRVQKEFNLELGPARSMVERIHERGMRLEETAQITGMTVSRVRCILTRLELEGILGLKQGGLIKLE